MFDLSLDHPAHVEFEAARHDLVESLVASEPAESIRWAEMVCGSRLMPVTS